MSDPKVDELARECFHSLPLIEWAEERESECRGYSNALYDVENVMRTILKRHLLRAQVAAVNTLHGDVWNDGTPMTWAETLRLLDDRATLLETQAKEAADG